MATTVWLALTLWLVMMIGELGVVTQSVRPLARLAYVSPGSKSSMSLPDQSPPKLQTLYNWHFCQSF